MKPAFASWVRKWSVSRGQARRQGIALITVLFLVAVMTLLAVTFLALARVEHASAIHYADGIQARTLSEAASNLVIDQLWSATEQEGAAREVESWVSQPGAIRRYGQDGMFKRGFKLYSDSAMVVTDEQELVDDAPPEDWDEQPARYVDLNAPVVRRNANDDMRELYFPIVDPRAYHDDPGTLNDERIEGFSYSKTARNRETELHGVVLPEDTEDAMELRLPMPVEWLYMLRDGTMGYLNEDNEFMPAELVSEQNPIVGRVAFWADDESSKLNINTSSEPTFWSPPYVYHEFAKNLALSQPARHEFQRYPGHPATTALSPVLFPNANLNYLDVYKDPARARAAARVKNQIYGVVPKINGGGSDGGTREITAFSGMDQDDLPGDREADGYNAIELSRRDRLYATLDEFMLGSDRQANVFPDINDDLGTGEVTADVIERGKFFLTANSRSPETNIFNLPRVSMWPIHEETAIGEVKFRTEFDQVIAFCSTLWDGQGEDKTPVPYHFLRTDADDPTEDVLLEENQRLFSYLEHLTDAPVPGYGGAFSDTERYGEQGERTQILAEVFDYIRSTNLHDDTLEDSTKRREDDPTRTPPRPREDEYGTFTDPKWERRVRQGTDADTWLSINAFGGHGQVTPAEFDRDGDGDVEAMGFGRFQTISEAFLHVIASADAGTGGDYDEGGVGYSNYPPVTRNVRNKIGEAIRLIRHSGRTGTITDSDLMNPLQIPRPFWHLVRRQWGEEQPALARAIPRRREGGEGYEPFSENWNFCLERNTPLESGKMKIQVGLFFEFFCPSAGWTHLVDAMHLRFKGLDNLKVNGQELFPDRLFDDGFRDRPDDEMDNDILVAIAGRNALGGYSGGARRGGSTGFRGFLNGRMVPDRFPLDQKQREVFLRADFGVDNDSGARDNRPWDTTGGLTLTNTNAWRNQNRRYPLISEFIEVSRSGSLQLQVDGPITIEIHSGTSGQVRRLERNLVQTIDIQFEPTSFAPPDLVAEHDGGRTNWRTRDPDDDDPRTTRTQRLSSRRAAFKQYWWSFSNFGLAVGRKLGQQELVSGDAEEQEWDYVQNDAGERPRRQSFERIGGRFLGAHERPFSSASRLPLEPINRNNHNRYNDGAWIHEGDVVLSMAPWHGDYRLIAARKHVPVEIDDNQVFVPHRHYGNGPIDRDDDSHNLVVDHNTNFGLGYDRARQSGAGGGRDRLALRVDYNPGRWPDFPATRNAARASSRTSDFDNGVANMLDGPYINKPDEGNIYVRRNNGEVPYLENFVSVETAGDTFFSPNRMIPSPVMLGSLPTGVKRDIPWRTLLFRPPVNPHNLLVHPGSETPPDHLLLDLFWMPVVEPYAISEPFSTAGRVNLNYQMLPFTHIRRATGLHGVLKGEVMRTTPTDAADRYLTGNLAADIESGYSRVRRRYRGAWESTLEDEDGWFYKIHLDETLKQFEKRFEEGEVFRSASEICDVHLIPDTSTTDFAQPSGDDPVPAMRNFWRQHSITGDNTREQPYGNIYPRLTTKSNTFCVHLRSQAIRKSSFTAPNTFVPGRDIVSSDYRGSTLIERYIDPADPRIPNYLESDSPLDEPGLDRFYRVRVVNSKRFDP